MPEHEPDGPVVVSADVPMALVRDSLGAGRRLARPDAASGWALLVTRDDVLADSARADGIPVVSASDDATLIAQLHAFDDGALITPREAELLAWIEAIRREEERNQRDHEQHVDQRLELLQARVDELTVYTDNLNAHLAAVEGTRAWRVATRLGTWKNAVLRLLPGRRHN